MTQTTRQTTIKVLAAFALGVAISFSFVAYTTQPTEAESKLVDKSGLPQIADQVAAITAISVTGNYTTDDTPIETAINDIISALEAHGLVADN